MTEEERNGVLSLLLKDGNFTDKTFWENEENGMIAVYNGSQSETVAQVNATAPHLRCIYGEGKASLSSSAVRGWTLSGGEWDDTFFCSDETYAGGGALGIRTTENAYIAQNVKNLKAGTTYTFTAWIKTVRGSGAIKAEYTGEGVSLSDEIRFYGSADGEWTKAEYTFTVPEGTATVGFLLRVIGGGEVYWDNVSLFDGETEIPLTNGGFEEMDSILTLHIPPETLMIFAPLQEMHRVLEKDNIIYEKPVSGATIRCGADDWASQYVDVGGRKEMIGFFVNGDTIQDGIGKIDFFRWDIMLRPKE